MWTAKNWLASVDVCKPASGTERETAHSRLPPLLDKWTKTITGSSWPFAISRMKNQQVHCKFRRWTDRFGMWSSASKDGRNLSGPWSKGPCCAFKHVLGRLSIDLALREEWVRVRWQVKTKSVDTSWPEIPFWIMISVFAIGSVKLFLLGLRVSYDPATGTHCLACAGWN